eukprot:752479-Hanusia_phi.AAC.1
MGHIVHTLTNRRYKEKVRNLNHHHHDPHHLFLLLIIIIFSSSSSSFSSSSFLFLTTLQVVCYAESHDQALVGDKVLP